jgi:hypothetical protein
VTDEMRLYASVATPTLHPAMVARMAVTIDSIAPGRFGAAGLQQNAQRPGWAHCVQREANESWSFAVLGDGPASTVELAAQTSTTVAGRVPHRRVHVVADAAYHGKSLRALPATVTWTTRLPRNTVLYHRAPAPTGRRGRPRLKGDRIRYPRPARRHLRAHPPAAWRARHPTARPAIVVPAQTQRRDITVYECLACETRHLAQQYCHDCHQPCMRIHLGGLCPTCDTPVTITDILDQHPTSPARP